MGFNKHEQYKVVVHIIVLLMCESEVICCSDKGTVSLFSTCKMASPSYDIGQPFLQTIVSRK